MWRKRKNKENRSNNRSNKENRSNNRRNKENRSNNRSNKEEQRNKLMQMSDRSLKRIYQELSKNQNLHSSGGRGDRREEERRNEDGWIEDGWMERRISKNNSKGSKHSLSDHHFRIFQIYISYMCFIFLLSVVFSF